MKAIYNSGGKPVLTQAEIPKPAKGEVLVRTRKTAISAATELFLMGKATPQTNEVMGYIATGVVEQVNDADSPVREGQRVFVTCGHAEYGVKDSCYAFPLPDELDFKAASACYWAVPALRGIHRLQPLVYDDVAVIGQGPIGLMAMQVLRHIARTVVVADINPFRLKRSAELGADLCLNPLEQDPVVEVGRLLPEGPARIIEASGTRAGLELAMKLARPRGTIVTLRIAADLSGLNFEQYMYRKDLRIIATGAAGMPPSRQQIFNREPLFVKTATDVFPDYWYFRKDVETAIEMLRRGYIRSESVITHEIKPEDAVDMYRKLADKSESQSILGVVIDWE